MATAVLLQEDLRQFCPITNHYQCSDGTWLLVSRKYPPSFEQFLGLDPKQCNQTPDGVDIFLSDERANVVDSDGDPLNGMTPLVSYTDDLTHEQALALLGYTVVEPEPEPEISEDEPEPTG